MILIGMMHHCKDPQDVFKSYAYAAVAKAEGAELLYFSPKAVDFDKKIINGYIYSNGHWKKTESLFPSVIYNTGNPERMSNSKDIIENLMRIIPFTSHSIGNKVKVYERIQEYGVFSQHLIPTQIIHTPEDFFDFIDIHKKVILKPIDGHQGQGIILVEDFQDYYHLLISTENHTYNWSELKTFIASKITGQQYLVQSYINSKTKLGFAYDLRLHVQKNEVGKWVITTIYPMIGQSGSIIANICSGGTTNSLIPFLKQEFGDEYYNIKRYLEHFSLQLAEHMDKIQKDYFSETLDELGIDVGLDGMGKIWIYEVNWRPGCPPTFYLELDVVRNMIRYAMFLSKIGNVIN